MLDKLEDSKISYLDAAFLGTLESQGFKNAKGAIKLCLFSDFCILDDKKIDYDKWLLISSKYDGRIKAKLLQNDDLVHILIKYCLASFAKRGADFSVNEDIYIEHRTNPLKSANLSRDEAVELVAFSAFVDVYNAYVFLFSNKYICNLVIDSFIEDRYLNMDMDYYDKFDGKITSVNSSNEFRYMFYKKYQKIDKEFAIIKYENENYVKE